MGTRGQGGEQAQVLERIATGEPVPTVLRKVVRLAAEVSGAQAVRIAAGEHTVVHPPEVDVAERPAWSATFLADAAGNTGSLEVFGGPELLDELSADPGVGGSGGSAGAGGTGGGTSVAVTRSSTRWRTAPTWSHSASCSWPTPIWCGACASEAPTTRPTAAPSTAAVPKGIPTIRFWRSNPS